MSFQRIILQIKTGFIAALICCASVYMVVLYSENNSEGASYNGGTNNINTSSGYSEGDKMILTTPSLLFNSGKRYSNKTMELKFRYGSTGEEGLADCQVYANYKFENEMENDRVIKTGNWMCQPTQKNITEYF